MRGWWFFFFFGDINFTLIKSKYYICEAFFLEIWILTFIDLQKLYTYRLWANGT